MASMSSLSQEVDAANVAATATAAAAALGTIHILRKGAFNNVDRILPFLTPLILST